MGAELIDPDAGEGLPEEDASTEGLTEEQKSFAEQALANLLTGPFDEVSITMPAALKQRIAARAVDMNFSAYVTEVLEREERRRSLVRTAGERIGRTKVRGNATLDACSRGIVAEVASQLPRPVAVLTADYDDITALVDPDVMVLDIAA